MNDRCSRQANRMYKHYGGRGIAVCERWQSFENFLADMGEPQPGMTLDRIDNDGNYEPGNCRWTTMAVQRRNSRQNVFLTHEGVTLCLTDWAAKVGLPQQTLSQRIIAGWDTKKALTTPPLSRCRRRVR